MTAVHHFPEKKSLPLEPTLTFFSGFCCEYTVQHFCDKRAAKNSEKHHIRQQVNILAIHDTGGVSVWFFKPFLMYPLSLKELGSNNTPYLRSYYLFKSFIIHN